MPAILRLGCAALVAALALAWCTYRRTLHHAIWAVVAFAGLDVSFWLFLQFREPPVAAHGWFGLTVAGEMFWAVLLFGWWRMQVIKAKSRITPPPWWIYGANMAILLALILTTFRQGK